MERRPARTHLSLYWPPANLWTGGHLGGQARAHPSLRWPLPSPEGNLARPSPPQSCVAHLLPPAPVQLCRIPPPPSPTPLALAARLHLPQRSGDGHVLLLREVEGRSLKVTAGLRAGSLLGRAAEEPQGKDYFPARTLSPGTEALGSGRAAWGPA